MDSASQRREPVAYRLTMGDRWWRIRLAGDAERDAGAYLDAMFAGQPADAAQTARTLLASRFAAQIAAGRARNGVDFYIPAPAPGTGAPPAHTVLVAEIVMAADAGAPADLVARAAAANPAARTGVIAGMPALRVDHTAAADEAELPEAARDVVGLRHVEYVVAVAGDPWHRWLSLAFTAQPTAGHDEAEADAAVAAFDQVVARLEWGAA